MVPHGKNIMIQINMSLHHSTNQIYLLGYGMADGRNLSNKLRCTIKPCVHKGISLDIDHSTTGLAEFHPILPETIDLPPRAHTPKEISKGISKQL